MNYYLNPFKLGCIIVICILFINTSTIAQTSVQAGTLSSAHWTLSGSPYKIMGHVIVANGDSLIIDPGVVVEFQGQYKLFCNGKIIANGTPNQRIKFTVPVANQSLGWLGIRYDNTPTTNGKSSFDYCIFEYGKANLTGDMKGGGLFFNKFSNCIISNCIFQNCYSEHGGGAIYAWDASPTIVRDTFYNNSYYSGGGSILLINSSSIIDSCLFMDAGLIFYNSYAKISNNTFTRCLHTGGVSCWDDPNKGYLEITNNIFDSCSQKNGGGGGGVLLFNAAAKIEHNIFKENFSEFAGGGAIACFTQSVYPNTNKTIISNNLIYGNRCRPGGFGNSLGGGAIAFSNCSGKVINNTIVDNFSDTAGGAIFCSTGSSPSFYNNIIYGNKADTAIENIFIIDNASDPQFYNNNIEGGYNGINTNGTPLVGANVNNIDTIPDFTNPAAGVYTLDSGSACINAGDTTGIGPLIPNLDLGGKRRIANLVIDMGAFEAKDTSTHNSVADVLVAKLCSVYPNPNRGAFTVELFNNANNANFWVYDVLGKEVYKSTLTHSKSQIQLQQSSGMYLLRVEVDGEMFVDRMMIQ